ncbi:non-specific lipid-transfer protein 3-like [Salvia splendens]|uniref:non-specific lipid-transfer protein 3-like n=1 Tax=Salvia splendens TaxID=180675 RepID=UPI001100138B|nr:non-specific lipid-transfer protein 3-like [Salvia splendens]
MKLLCILIAVALIAAVAAPLSDAAISCTAVLHYVTPCKPYVTGGGPIGPCCSGARSLNAAARTTSDRQKVCNCLKSETGRGYTQANLKKAEEIPSRCGINIPYKISRSTDCAKVR